MSVGLRGDPPPGSHVLSLDELPAYRIVLVTMPNDDTVAYGQYRVDDEWWILDSKRNSDMLSCIAWGYKFLRGAKEEPHRSRDPKIAGMLQEVLRR